MSQYHTKSSVSTPMLLLGLIEAIMFAGMPLLAAFILNTDGTGLPLPSLVQAFYFAAAVLVMMLAFGLYDGRRQRFQQGDLLRTAWAFSLTGALLVFASGLGPAPALPVSVVVVALSIGFFVQRTIRLVYFDAVQIPTDNSHQADSLRELLTPRG